MNDHLDGLLREAGRDPDAVDRSVMTQVVFGRDEAELDEVLDGRDPDELRERGAVVGTPAEVAEGVERLGEAGVDRVMLQWLALDDTDRLEALADALV